MFGELLEKLFKRFLWFPFVLAFISILGLVWYTLSQLDWENLQNTPIVVILVVTVLSFLVGILLWWSYKRTARSLNFTEEFLEINEEIVKNTDAIDILSTIGNLIAKCLREPFSKTNNRHTFHHICWMVRAFMINKKSKDPKVVLFIPNDAETHLEPYGWASHSMQIQKFTPIISQENSAGFTYMTGEPYYLPDVNDPGARFEYNNHSDNSFHSLVTVPVKCGKEVIGVLSVTGEEKNSYIESEDIPYLRAFANALSPLVSYHLSGRKGVYGAHREEVGSKRTEDLRTV
ncbi:GAF domain-containing protein [Polycladomyces subterraneus]|uniref:GAF domain-containing protein n=1 Tax=Polycladomyces subterraneus TaxID=1016997 RepID=A0ABT8IRJ6_9BACL|nr:GAF domain-containing protein [Polycladomyces subterraneus]MDN4595428.1 GAF domain-containing protein [Polycladomyces subterraneus]